MMGPFDRDLLRRRRAHAARSGAQADYLAARIAEDFAERLLAVQRDFPLALEIGATGHFARALAAGPAPAKIGTLLACDFVEEIARRSPLSFVADEENLPISPASLDLVVSGGVLQWTNDLPGALTQIRNALKPDGLFLGALIGGSSLGELRQAFLEAEAELEGGASPRVAPMVDVRDLGGLLQRAGFALPVTDIDRVTVSFASPWELLADLRAMGATNFLTDRRKTPLRRATLMRAVAIYTERFANEAGRIPATFEILHAAGWAPHASQQKPLKPGSATYRLAEALGTSEHGTGEPAKP